MKKYEPNIIRNVGMFSHGGEGKTSIVEAMLFLAGENNRIGRVDDGTSLMDYEPEEIERKITISSSLACFEWNKHKFNLLDTPGDDNFIADAKLCMKVVDSAVIIMSAVSGVKVQTEKVWEYTDEFGIPSCIFINKMDRERADFNATVEDIKKNFTDRTILPIHLPIGKEDSFKGIVNLLSMKAYIYKDDTSGAFDVVDIPQDLLDEANNHREKLVEVAVEMDDDVMERYLNGEGITNEEIERCLKNGIWNKKIVPVLCGSASKNIGIQLILDTIVQYYPPPTFKKEIEAIDIKTGETIMKGLDPDGPFSAFVFKTITDPFAGKLTLFRVYSGEVHPDMTVLNATKEQKERIGQIFYLVGKKQKPAGFASFGDIAVLAKLKDVGTGDTLCDEKSPVKYKAVTLPTPLISFSLQPKAKGDEDKLNSSLTRLMEEDLTIRYKRDEQTKEFILSGMGQIHIEVIVEKLKRKFGVDVELKEPKVPYKETIKGTAKVQGKYKRQSGGRGQYGDTWLEISPLPRGAGFEFVDKIVGGVIPKQYIPAVEKGIVEAMEQGMLAGYPVTDIRVSLYDGSYHEVDSSEMAFKIAASMGFKKGMEAANPTLLEPIMKVEVIVPDENMGDVMGDLNSRRGKIMGVESKGNNQVVKATVPMAEILKYAPDLRSMTGGRGTFTVEFSHYEEVPAHIAAKIIENAKKEKEQEK
ncbi:MAG TPA: elongation factor G [Syntrophorhabdaceae bacterium]|nr:elongation factor G [Syntrophorhabdaceae bacterium]HOT41379.1 elongation factor G [Syntrophorhabdaceae bacterium]HPP42719.1 elongation factor G [Syntrophorhabdaceae bacterium]HQH44144.1 elongation factor G [Syntrophorhabdaceae bacterium]